MAILPAATETAMRRVIKIVVDIMVMARKALAVAIGRATVMLIQSNCDSSCNTNNDDASIAGGTVTVTVTVIATVLVAVIIVMYVYMYMGGCQNYGPFLGTLNIRCRIIIGIHKGTIILTTTHIHEKEYSTRSTDTFSIKVGASSHGPPGI